MQTPRKVPAIQRARTSVVLSTVIRVCRIFKYARESPSCPFANGHDGLSLAYLNILHTLMTVDSTTLVLALWMAGTFLGVCITLILAGSEMRTQWFKAMMERLPVR